MGFDDDILQDFLIEAAEILELLSEQLVDLEKSPEDRVLLNAIFRGFHTVKGGAGFLALTPLVETCHGAENIFDNLRNGGRTVTAEVMDVILQALDTVNEQFNCARNGIDMPLADPSLLEKLHLFSKPEVNEDTKQTRDDVSSVVNTDVEIPSQNSPNTKNIFSNETTDDEFEQLLDEIHGRVKSGEDINSISTSSNTVNDQMTEDEFEKLLDELHGKGGSPTSSSEIVKNDGSTEDFDVSQSEQVDKEKTLIEQAKQTALAIKAENNKAVQAEQTIRVNTSTLDNIMNMIGELVLVRNRLISLGADSGDGKILKAVTNLDVVTADLQNAVMQTRMQPIKKVFGRFPRVVRDLARSLKKEIVLEMYGEETDLDKNLVEALADPMVHLIRNSIDHGIELPNIREAKGKPRVGTIKLKASQEGDNILLSIQDDGGGMNANKLRAIAIERGLIDHDVASRLSDLEAFNLIFYPGFSTKNEISDISGRGVGMDVVKNAINQLNGTISIDSNLDVGTNILIKVPLTLAILPTLMVGIGGSPFALPLSSVNEIIKLDTSKINIVNGQLTLIVRDKAIPLFYMQDWFYAKPDHKRQEGHVVVVQLGHQTLAFVVDSLIGQEEVVIKPLDNILQKTPGMAGATITSNGNIALILDIPDLLSRYASSELI